jgi:energy-converting hydrogenase A subunit M
VTKYEIGSEVLFADQKMFLFPSTVTKDLKECVGSDLFSDITFEEEDLQENTNSETTNFSAHKVIISSIYSLIMNEGRCKHAKPIFSGHVFFRNERSQKRTCAITLWI